MAGDVVDGGCRNLCNRRNVIQNGDQSHAHGLTFQRSQLASGSEQGTYTSPADGYTLLVAASPITINPAINENVRYNVFRDFAPISQIIVVPSVLVVNPAVPARTLAEFLAAANSGQVR